MRELIKFALVVVVVAIAVSALFRLVFRRFPSPMALVGTIVLVVIAVVAADIAIGW